MSKENLIMQKNKKLNMSRRIRRTPFTNKVEECGVSDFTVVNHISHNSTQHDFLLSIRKYRNQLCLKNSNHPWNHVVGSSYKKIIKNDTHLELETLYATYSIFLYMSCVKERDVIKQVIEAIFENSIKKSQECKNSFLTASKKWWYAEVYFHPRDGIIRLMIDTIRKSSCIYTFSQVQQIANECYTSWNTEILSQSCVQLNDMCVRIKCY